MRELFNKGTSVIAIDPIEGKLSVKITHVFDEGCWVWGANFARRYYKFSQLRFNALEEPFPGGDAALTEVIGTQPKKDMKYDADKPRMDLLLSGCPLALEAVSSILTFGAKKYSAHSWQTVERGDERYLAALLRHLTAHAKGEKLDPESGISHLAHAACNAMFILELELRK